MKKIIVGICLMAVALSACSGNVQGQDDEAAKESFSKEQYYTEGENSQDQVLISDVDEILNKRCGLSVSVGGEVVYVSEDGKACGSDTYTKRLEQLCDGAIAQLILNENITVLGTDGRIYTEGEFAEMGSGKGVLYNIGGVALDNNRDTGYSFINGSCFPALDLLVLTTDGRVLTADIKILEMVELILSEDEEVTYLDGNYALTKEGHVYKVNLADRCLERVEGFENIVMIDAYDKECVALTNTGEVSITHENELEFALEVFGWSNIVDIALGDGFCVGLKSDGTLEVYGNTHMEEALGITTEAVISGWTDVKAITTDGYNYIAGLTNNNEILINYKREIPEFLTDIADAVYYEHFRVWDGAEDSVSSYETVGENVCELEINGELHKAIYSDSGIVVIENDKDYTLVYNGKSLSIPVEASLYGGYNRIITKDYNQDDIEEIVFYCDTKWGEWFYPVRLDTMEFIEVSYDEVVIDELFDYGIDRIEADDNGDVKVFFYIEDNKGNRFEGDVVIYGGNILSDYVMCLEETALRVDGATSLTGMGYFVVREAGAEGRMAQITFDVRIKYDMEKEKFAPVTQNVAFNWLDATLHLRTEYLEIE